MEINRIALIGFMCSGKSMAGAALATRLGYPFYDSDSVIERRTGMRIPEIFRLFGEGSFRRQEREMIDEICRNERFVLATGGGSVISAENRAALRQTLRVYLWLDEAELVRRLSFEGGRPLIGENAAKDVSRLMRERGDLYSSFANIILNADGKTPDEISEEIVMRLRVKSG